jgi:hypothetical protein
VAGAVAGCAMGLGNEPKMVAVLMLNFLKTGSALKTWGLMGLRERE